VERLTERLLTATRAVGTLGEIAGRVETTIERDAAIKRFEYSFEAVWHLAQQWLRDEGVLVGSPAATIRACVDVDVLTPADGALALAMLKDRNAAVHVYLEPLAAAIAARVPDHHATLERWLAALSARIGAPA
jgi:nucleotidyltransferase substrate binding protein (TIGR01987 family)